MVNLRELPAWKLEKMARAGEQILECYRGLEKGGGNNGAEVVADTGKVQGGGARAAKA